MYVCKLMRVHIYGMCMYVSLCACIAFHNYAGVCTHMYVHGWVYMHVYMYMCVVCESPPPV